MTGRVIFLTHAEVQIDPKVPVPEWGLNDVGRARHLRFATDPVLAGVTAVYASTETKAIEGARPVADAKDLPLNTRKELGENDRSATGYLPPNEFWPVVETFFSEPDQSVRGWERACDAQGRIVGATRAAADQAPAGDVLIVAHGGVATLLRCHLGGCAITQAEGAPHPGGGCWFSFRRTMDTPATDWTAI